MPREAQRKHLSLSLSDLAEMLGEAEFDAIHAWVEPEGKYLHLELTAVEPDGVGWLTVPFDGYTEQSSPKVSG